MSANYIHLPQDALTRVDRFLAAFEKGVDAFVELSTALVSLGKKIETQIDEENKLDASS